MQRFSADVQLKSADKGWWNRFNQPDISKYRWGEFKYLCLKFKIWPKVMSRPLLDLFVTEEWSKVDFHDEIKQVQSRPVLLPGGALPEIGHKHGWCTQHEKNSTVKNFTWQNRARSTNN